VSSDARTERRLSREELANFRNGSPERLVPGLMRGQVIEADHLSRYYWASQFVAGRRVLDAGCGMAYGTALLAESGAAEAVGIDIAASVVEAAAADVGDAVRLEVGDLSHLNFTDGSFDVVVCFETIEHVEEPFAAMDELVRVLAPGGLIIISTPDRNATYSPNPHHRRELTRDELQTSLASRLANVQILRQQTFLGSTILKPGVPEEDEALSEVRVRRLADAAHEPGNYLVALAADEPLPKVAGQVTLGSDLDYRTWQGAIDAAMEHVHDHEQAISQLEALTAQENDLLAALLDAETRLAKMAEHRQRITDLETEIADLRRMASKLEERIVRADRVLLEVKSSPSWRITTPLRAAKQLLRR
jgi:SAM-dependent methyltransferase